MERITVPNDKAMPILLQYRGKRYDVTEFAKKHPGGEKVSKLFVVFFFNIFLSFLEKDDHNTNIKVSKKNIIVKI